MARRRIVCIGDSNTYGYDPRSYLGGRYPAAVRWTSRLEATGWEAVNEGENGRCIPRLPQEVRALTGVIRRAEADLAAVMLGSNDLLQGASAGVCAERMEHFLTLLREETPCQILLIAPPPMQPGAWVNDPGTLAESRRLADEYKALAEKPGILFADAGGWGIDIAFDGVHFTEAGHRAFAAGIAGHLPPG